MILKAHQGCLDLPGLHRGAGKARAPALNTRGGKKHRYSCWRWGRADGAWDVAKLYCRLPSPSPSARAADLTCLLSVVRNYEGAFGAAMRAAPATLATFVPFGREVTSAVGRN